MYFSHRSGFDQIVGYFLVLQRPYFEVGLYQDGTANHWTDGKPCASMDETHLYEPLSREGGNEPKDWPRAMYVGLGESTSDCSFVCTFEDLYREGDRCVEAPVGHYAEPTPATNREQRG